MRERAVRRPGLAGRPAMRSPGRRFWRKMAEGLSREDAAVACGVSMPLGPRWFRLAGGMAPISLLHCQGGSCRLWSERRSRS